MFSELNRQISFEPPIRLLMADDEPANLKAMQRILRHEDLTLETCGSGTDAVALTETNDYDLILMDILMPGMTGLEACRKIHQGKPDLPIIMMTAVIDDDAIQQAFRNGAADYLRKPINSTELILRIHNLITSNRAETRLKALYDKILEDLTAAAEIQALMLPDRIDSINGFSSAIFYRPASQVSGDILDIDPIDEHRTLIYIGDISGHGIQAALLTSAVRSIIRMLVSTARNGFSFSGLAVQITRELDTLFLHQYMTFLLGCFDTAENTFEYINCGHPPLLLLEAAAACPLALTNNGEQPIGWHLGSPAEPYQSNRLVLESGSTLFFYTDGLLECTDANGHSPGVSGLAQLLADALTMESDMLMLPEVLKERLVQQGFQLESDDCTLLAWGRKSDKHATVLKILPRLPEVGISSRQAEKFVDDFTHNRRLSSSCELIVTEFLNNIILHGYRETTEPEAKSDNTIYLHLHFDPDNRLILDFYDRGCEWQLPEPATIDLQPEPFVTSGRGINIIRTLAATVTRIRHGGLNRTSIQITSGG